MTRESLSVVDDSPMKFERTMDGQNLVHTREVDADAAGFMLFLL